jgi:alpha-amylase
MKMTHITQSFAAVVLLTLSSMANADVILHAFNWQYSEVTAKADEIANLGYKKVLVSPAYKSTGNEWWARYQPQDIRVIDNPLGNKQDFQAMINALSARGVDVYADIVFNHKANESWKRSDLNYPGTDILNEYAANSSYFAQQTLFGDITNNYLGAGDFHAPGCIQNYNNRGEVQYYRLCGGNGDTGLPDLDPNNWVVQQQKAYLNALKSMGVKGFRVDAAKHMTSYHLNAVFDSNIKNGMHIIGEIITSGGAGDSGYDTFLAPYLNETDHSAYDFPLFAQIRSALGYGGSMNQLVDPGAYGQALPASRALTFSVTHDIPLNDGFRYQIMNATDEYLANAYVLGRDGGTPMMYSDHNESNDGGRWQDLYKRSDVADMIEFHNGVQGQGMQIMANNDCILLFNRGYKGIVGINKCSSTQEVWVDTGQHGLYWYRTYRDTLNGSNTNYINSTWHKFTLSARSAHMWLME